MILLGSSAPDFELPGILNGQKRAFKLSDFNRKWLVLFFYPADFTFICPTEITGFQKQHQQFVQAGAQIAGISCDPPETHQKWIDELGGISYPLLSDTSR